ncbi:MAG: class I SAM-dependent methyltransferase [Candidatus Lokiarchaeota archaeon]|jgi:ubiquinone/menaquinone biosynthesis C-methylase UbiE
MRCKFCNNTRVIEFDSIKSLFYSNKSYTLYECKNCGCQFFDIHQHEISIDDMYESLANEKVQLSIQFSPRQYWTDQKNLILKMVSREPTSILDVGCRTGDFLLHFNKDIIREGVEISNSCAEIAMKRGLDIYNQSIEDLSFTKTYEVVTAYNILEHLIDPKKFLRKLTSITKKEGVIAILIPTHECLKVKVLKKLRRQWHMYVPPEHLNFFSRRYLDSFMEYYGFKLMKRYYSSGGLFNPFKKIRFLNWVFGKFMYYIDKLILYQLPLFDHVFSYYKKIR